ncbi:hypothetical protein R1flu_002493 [Riccia fluitans]|uniref:Aspartate/ornithine carbamoyltransferase carbamoyl-P binding domain-containing protein n=1 Tax=Riccia fluitans TaxID=41844 RepID=A0ABD1Y697_9MARC
MEQVEKDKNSSSGHLLDGFLMAALFYEPSTRTRLSFESAMKRLGGEVLTTENAREFSSAAKGETLEGLFHDRGSDGAAKRAAEVANVPVINAGDGPGQHPTQDVVESEHDEM